MTLIGADERCRCGHGKIAHVITPDHDPTYPCLHCTCGIFERNDLPDPKVPPPPMWGWTGLGGFYG